MTTQEEVLPKSVPVVQKEDSFCRTATTGSMEQTATNGSSSSSASNEMDAAAITMDQSNSSLRDESSTRSTVSRSLTGDLNDIVNSVARRAGRRQPRSEKVASPTRRTPYSPLNKKQVRVPRDVRNQTKHRDGRSRSPRRMDAADSTASNDKAAGYDMDISLSEFQRQSTISSRDRFMKMLDAKTLGSFRDLNKQVVENNKPRTYMSRLYVTFQDCLHDLNAKNVSNRKLEAMAVLIHECMSGSSRNYHSVQHVFEISKDFTDPLAILAAMFHDAIYHTVDITLSPQQEMSLRGCFQVTEDGGAVSEPLSASAAMTCRAHDASCHSDPNLCLVETVFGYSHGQEITGNDGLNEFLSAVVAVRNLQEHLTKVQCAKIATCIAATVPFRNKPAVHGGKTRMEELYDNLVETNSFFELGMSEKEMVESLQRAALLANADVGNFGSDDIYFFLDNTWSLLTETNTTLRSSFLYTVMEFQHSLFKMNGFFHFLNPQSIFANFKGTPSTDEIQQKTEQARKNLELGQKYVGAKLLSASVLAAFAVLTGGDAPLSLFVGDLPSRHHQSQSINDALPTAGENPMCFGHDDDNPEEHLDLLVYQILTGGRRSETSFDVKQSPLGAFLYAVVGDRGLRLILDSKELYPMTEENAKALLSCLPCEVVRYLAKTIASVAICRAEEIMEVANNLPVTNLRGCEASCNVGSHPSKATVSDMGQLEENATEEE